MNIEISETSKTEHGTYFQATCNKVSALVSIHSHGVQVCCQNRAHQVWRKAGRLFPTADAALAAYKSGEMKAIIQAALDLAKAP